ncbi:thioesterase II family protein [Actinophytocola sediminis]
MTHPTTPWVRRLGAGPDAHRLVCFPYAGGTAKYYLPYARSLAADAQVLAIQYPGRQERRDEPPIDDLDELTRQVVDAVLPLTDRPVTFFGHSMGAALAFEVARQLEGKGVVLAGLFVSGRRAPSHHRFERTHLLDDQRLLDSVRRLAGVSARLPGFDTFARNALPLIRVDYRAAETYQYVPGPPLSCPLTALTGDADPLAAVEEVASWRDHTTGRFRLRVFGGGHFYLDEHRAPIVDLLAEHLATGT